MKDSKPIIGLCGGIGAGKSVVASLLAELGAGVISSDRLNHEELDSAEVLARLQEWWGPRVVGAGGKANRGAIRAIIQDDASARQRLEHLVHPRIAQRREEWMRRFNADDRIRAIVWDSPLLFEAGLAARCDAVVFVEADPQTRLAWVARDRGWTPADLERFENLQKPLDFKRERADYRVVNNSDMDALRPQVESVFSRILSRFPDPDNGSPRG